jgi:hypothetical protein
MTLDEFLETKLNASAWPNNAYVKEPKFTYLYVRRSRRYIGDRCYEPVLDIARVEARKPGKGAFTALVKRLRAKHPELPLFVECVLNKRFRAKLEALGFKRLNPDDDFSPNYWLYPRWLFNADNIPTLP